MFSNNIKVLSCNLKKDICLIAFSSNSATNGKFEFERICESKTIRRRFNKIIFLRDPNCRFYINGINNETDSIFKILELCKSLTKDKKIYCIGYSAGGYMSLLLGCYLNNIERVLNFGGIIDVLSWHGSHSDYNFSDSRFVKESTLDKQQYFNISNKMHNINCNVFSFYAANAVSDAQIIDQIKELEITNNHLVLFNTKRHGDYCLPFDYKKLLTSNDKYLKKVFTKYHNRVVSPNRFSCSLHGPLSFVINYMIRKVKNFIKIIRK